MKNGVSALHYKGSTGKRRKMSYRTVDEVHHFDFQDAKITEIKRERGHLIFFLEYVTILPENSCNRDIRRMGTNELTLQLQHAEILHFVEEGYKVYDADGNLKETCEDREIELSEYERIFDTLAQGTIYSLHRRELGNPDRKREYKIYIDTDAEENGHTYLLLVKGDHDVQQWERFMNRDTY